MSDSSLEEKFHLEYIERGKEELRSMVAQHSLEKVLEWLKGSVEEIKNFDSTPPEEIEELKYLADLMKEASKTARDLEL